MPHQPTRTPTLQPRAVAVLLLVAVALVLAAEAWASLGHGHLRARTRNFSHAGVASLEFGAGPQDGTVKEGEAEAEFEVEAEATVVVAAAAVNEPPMKAVAIGGNAGARRGLIFKKADTFDGGPRAGYLAFGPPRPMRFSDASALDERTPSPALPEFTMMSRQYEPYLIESPLPEDARNDPTMLSEVVVDLSPHTVVSGVIDTSRKDMEEKVEHFDLEENRTTVLRPADVLRYFETDGVNYETKVLIPFSPATPATETIDSSATYKIE